MLTIPKQVLLKNTRLNVLYGLLLAVTIAAYAVYFLRTRKYVTPVDISRLMYINAGPAVLSDSSALRQTMEIAFNRSAPTVCGTNGSQCLRLCTQNGEIGCREDLDLVQVENPHTMFLPTYVHESDSPKGLPYYLPYLDEGSAGEFSMNVEFGFERPMTNIWTNQIRQDGAPYASSSNIQTVLLKDGEIWRILQPKSKPLNLTLQDIFEMASVGKAFPDPWDQARKSGLEIDITVQCFNRDNFKQRMVYSVASNHAYETCQMTAHLLSTKRVSKYTGSITSKQFKVFGGIRLNFRANGSWERVYWGTFLDSLVDLFVLLALPRAAVVQIAISCLGPLSNVYFHIVHEYFGIRQCAGGMATRLMAHSASYLHLLDAQGSSGAWGISQKRMLERMKACLKQESNISDSELRHLVQFCFESVHRYAEHEHHSSLIKAMIYEKAIENGTEVDCNGLMFENEFGQAMRNNETVKFSQLLPLFSTSRKLGFLENLFTPTYLHKLREMNALKSSTISFEQDERDEHDEHHEPEADMSVKLPTSTIDSPSFKAMSLEEQHKQNTLLLARVRELDIQSSKAIQTLVEMRRDLQDANDKTEHVKKENSKLLETCSAQFTCQLESVNRSIEDVKNRVENQMLMQEAVNSSTLELLRYKSDRRLSHGGSSSSLRHVDGIASISTNEAKNQSMEQSDNTEEEVKSDFHDVDSWCHNLYRTETTNI